MIKVSIIMPIYNAEKYLSGAIESVLNQTYSDFELILVNDKSTDNSKLICQEYKSKDNRIVLLENNSGIHGPGPTRNIGLDYATGKYIYFMDADDWIELELLECSVNKIEETNADIVQFGVVNEYNGMNNSYHYYWKGKKLLTKDDIKNDFFRFINESRNSLWIHMFRYETIKSIRFDNIISGEDICFVIDALSVSKKISFIPDILYHYRYVYNSNSRIWNASTIDDRLKIWNHQKSFIESFKGQIDDSLYAEVAYDNYIWAIYQLSSNLCTLSYSDKKNELCKLKEYMNFDKYRKIYPLKMQHGIEKMKYGLVKYRLEKLALLIGPIFLKLVRGE